jgi:hypothetical protein
MDTIWDVGLVFLVSACTSGGGAVTGSPTSTSSYTPPPSTRPPCETNDDCPENMVCACEDISSACCYLPGHPHYCAPLCTLYPESKCPAGESCVDGLCRQPRFCDLSPPWPTTSGIGNTGGTSNDAGQAGAGGQGGASVDAGAGGSGGAG